MGAALFRRALKTAGITGIQVEVYAADLIEEDIDLIVCQKEFYALNPQLHEKACHVIAGFTDREEYTKLIQCIQDAPERGNTMKLSNISPRVSQILQILLEQNARSL